MVLHLIFADQWTLEELSHLMKVPPSILRKRIMFWQSHGIIKEKEADVYVLIEEGESQIEIENQSAEICEDDESESAMASASDQREEELQVSKKKRKKFTVVILLKFFISFSFRYFGHILLVC